MSLGHVLTAPLLAAVAYAQEEIVRRDDSSSSSAASSSSASPSSSSSGSSSSASATASSSDSGTTNAPSSSVSLPPLAGATTYSYPAPSVPPTANAPYMQKSGLPNGTFFICVGAVLGFFFLMVIAWRAWAAWMLHRRMNAANVQYVGVPTGPPGGSPKDKKLRKSALYQRDAGSEMSLDALTKKENQHARRSSKAPKDNRQSTLFFSPTAGAGAHGTAQQRASSFLPSGYYAAGGSTVGSTVVNANSTSDLSMRTDNRLSMADFGAPQRHSSPYKDSPLLRPQDAGHGLEPPNLPFARNAGARTSVASLSGSETNSRAPSAYLEDLFDSTPVKERRSNERDDFF